MDSGLYYLALYSIALFGLGTLVGTHQLHTWVPWALGVESIVFLSAVLAFFWRRG